MTAPTAPLPTFLIIGAQKSATRWLRVNLGQHPDVYTAPTETMFFHSPERFDERGLEWYRQQFPGWSGEPIVGEGTPGYMMWRHRPRLVASRIKEVVPDAQLLAILRNPVDRAESAMSHFISRGRLPLDSNLLELVRRTPPQRDPRSLVTGGWYAASLKPFQALFGDQLLVVLHDDIVENPDRVYKQALHHIGAAPEFTPTGLESVLFSTKRSSSEGSSSAASNGERELSERERQELFAYFRKDVSALEKMIGRDLSIWDPGGSYSVELTVDPWRERSRRPARREIDIVRCYEPTAEWIAGLVDAVSLGQYGLVTPCPDWNVRDLLNRIVGLPRLGAAILRGAHPPNGEQGFLDPDASAAFRAAADDLLRAMGEPESLDGRIATPMGEMPATAWAQFIFINQLTYGWDLATATGQDSTIPPSLLEVADRLVRGSFAGMPRMPELFDVEVPVGDAANPTARFVAFLGRDPGFRVDARGD